MGQSGEGADAGGGSSSDELPDLDLQGRSSAAAPEDSGSASDADLPELYSREAQEEDPDVLPAARPAGGTGSRAAVGTLPSRPPCAPQAPQLAGPLRQPGSAPAAKPVDYSRFDKIEESEGEPDSAAAAVGTREALTQASGQQVAQAALEASFEALLAEVLQVKAAAGAYYARWEVRLSARCLRHGLALLQPHQLRWRGIGALRGVRGVLRRLRTVQVAMLANLALCYLYGEPPDAPPRPLKACWCCEQALELDPTNTKALLRKGKALAQLGRHADAAAARQCAAELASGGAAVRRHGGQSRDVPGDGGGGSRGSAAGRPGVRQALEQVGPAAAKGRLLGQVQRARRLGNEAVKQGEIEQGAFCYEEGLRLAWSVPDGEGRLEPLTVEQVKVRLEADAYADETMQRYAELLRVAEAALLTNLALCYLKGHATTEWPPDVERARRLCDLALVLEPTSTKALFRKGQALMELGRSAEAEAELVRAARQRPDDLDIRRELEKVREAHRSRQAVRWSDAEKRALTGKWEKLAGFATPAGLEVQRSWPEAQLPAPLSDIGADNIDPLAELLVESCVYSGGDAYLMDLLGTLRHFVVLRYGEGAGQHLGRTVPLVQRAANCKFKQAYQPGCGQQRVSLELDGLPPAQPLYEGDTQSWGASLSSQADAIHEELFEAGDLDLWEVPRLWGLPHPECAGALGEPTWRSVNLVQEGVWVAGGRFPSVRGILGMLEGMSPHTVGFVQMPPQTRSQLHRDSTNYVITGLFSIDFEVGEGALCVGEWLRELRGGELLVFGSTYSHLITNRSRSCRHALCFSFFHRDVSDVERYALLLLGLLFCGIQKSELYQQSLLLPDGADAGVLKSLQQHGLRFMA